ncbi:methyltransferase family protein [Streptococcus macacae]|uniref:Isoprenylcysteine carboxyl methyltransferase family protein n=1 Tax=Streptococcus macacae NCTC 11558 TaxID=764298 RepID=G5JV96_9STRE|nr:isoprenylcysteine carboxylmethyltransferase family protein [Streptococcus macacae]EHJ52692.1 isoprenylcysteine carboxyl methyltransferase family protein [Streptococcus macacae NCTC 11558]SUN77722.1 nickel-cobalt-cadmium resistance protein [Streptococcus macacae NCTC 11558]
MIHYQTTILYGLLILWGLTEWFIKNRTKTNGSDNSQDKGTRYVIIISIVLSIAMLNNPFKITILLPEWGIYLGIILMLCGIILRVYAINYLGKAFTLNVQTTDEQELVRSGPYALVRNPAYSGTIISILGLAFVTLNVFSILLVLIVLSIGYAIRIHTEEQALQEHFGNAYHIYCQKVKYRLFPYIW